MIKLLEAQDVMIFVAFGPIKRAELAVNVANVCLIDVAIDDVGHDLATAVTVAFGLREIASRVR